MPTSPSEPNRVLVLFAHPAYEKSRVHRHLARAAQAVPGVTFHDLYETYPDGDIDVGHEQHLLTAHAQVVLQHPFYWYSVPPLLKQWMDLVLEHGWAYGSKGRALEGKVLQVAMTAGGREQAYGPSGNNRHSFREFLLPLEATARLCRMEFREPFVVAGTHAMTSDQSREAAERYAALLQALVEEAQ